MESRRLYDECTSLEETPRGDLEYTVLVKADLPWRRLRNVMYWLTPSFSPERAHERREKIIKDYNLQKEDVVVYARSGASLSRP